MPSSSTEDTSSEDESSVDWEMEERRAEFNLPPTNQKKRATKARK